MSTADERADLNAHPLPPEQGCSTCRHSTPTGPGGTCALQDAGQACTYALDIAYDETAPLLERTYRLQVRIQEMQEALKKESALFDSLMDRVVKSEITVQGNYSLIDKPRTVRVIKPAEFRAMFSDAYETLRRELVDAQMKKIDDILLQDLTTIPVKRAEELVGKEPLKAVVEPQIYHAYRIMSTEGSS